MEPHSIHKRVVMQDGVAKDGWAPRYPLLNNAVVDTFGERLKAKRIEKGLSQPALAAESGVSQSTISRIERGDGGHTHGDVWALTLLLAAPPWVLDGLRGAERLDADQLAWDATIPRWAAVERLALADGDAA